MGGRRRARIFAYGVAVVTIAGGSLVLAGWAAQVGALKGVLPGLATMKPNTALAFLLSGAALAIVAGTESPPAGAPGNRARGEIRVIAARACAAAVFLTGALTLFEYLAGIDLGIDELLFRDDASQEPSSHPGRPAPATAANFCMLGAALLALDFETRRGAWPAQWLAAIVALIGCIALAGYAYGVAALYGVFAFASVALHSALLFVLLAAGVVCARPGRGVVGLMTAGDAGALVLRRLLPPAILAPPAIAWLCLAGERAGLYGFEFGLALFALSSVVIFVAVALRSAQSARKSEARLAATVESAPMAIVAVDAAGRIALANAQTEALFGYERAELLGRPVEILLPARFRESHPVLRASYLGRPTARPMGRGRDLFGARRDGTEFPVEVGISPASTDEGPWVLAAIADITERTRQATALRQANEALVRSNIELQRFAYVASHDLQTPLRTIASFAELLRTTYADKLDGQGKDWIERVVGAVRQLQALVRDVLEYARVDSEVRPFERLDLRAILDQAAALLETPIRESGASVTSGALPAVMGDRSQLVQLMLNLVGNALKYRGAQIPRIHVFAERSGGEWIVSVQDNGIGIAPRHHERIFEIFTRLHSQREYPGSGIGLAVCRRIVHRHGGRIWVESEPGRGSTFRFSIPHDARSPA